MREFDEGSGQRTNSCRNLAVGLERSILVKARDLMWQWTIFVNPFPDAITLTEEVRRCWRDAWSELDFPDFGDASLPSIEQVRYCNRYGYWLVSSIAWYSVCFMIEFDTHDVLCLVSSIILILSLFYVLYQDIVWYLIKFYVTFQGCHLGVFMVIVYKAPVSLTSVFKPCYSPNLERADFGRQSFQYTCLNSYLFSSLRESIETKHT